MGHLPNQLYTAKQVRMLDNIAIEQRGIAGIHLMKQAARASFIEIQKRYSIQQLNVFCGGGNNAGDAYIVAALAKSAGWPVTIVYLVNPEKLTGDAKLACEFSVAAGVEALPFSDDLVLRGLVVDGLLGTGLQRAVEGSFATAIECINSSSCQVISLDIPSGLDSDTGSILGCAVNADVTVSFIGLKQGMFTGKASDYCGEICFSDLNVPEDIYQQVSSQVTVLDLQSQLKKLSPRNRSSHKGQFGRVLVVGGELGFGGAAALAAEACLRVGSGLVTVATKPEHVTAVLVRNPSAMVHGVQNIHQFERLLQSAEVVVIGPGLGKDPWGRQLLQAVLTTNLPTVIDADGLNLIAEKNTHNLPSSCVLTPHPGEAARLLGVTVDAVESDRYKAVRELNQRYQAAFLLKGAGSLMCNDPESVAVSIYGNPGMATGGMGDVLSGVIGGLLAQGLAPMDALSLAVCLHGRTADIAVKRRGERGLLPIDLFKPLQKLVNGLVQ